MSLVRFTPAARADLAAIWNYTLITWGEVQAVRYTETIRDACHDVAHGIRATLPVAIRPTGWRRFMVGSHVVFLVEQPGEGIAVVRILHRRMDAGRNLP